MKTQQALPLNEPEGPPSTIHINGRCNYREEGEMKVVFANGIPLFHYAKADKAADHYAMIHLVESGLASQQEIASAFACSRLTVLRAKRKFDQGARPGGSTQAPSTRSSTSRPPAPPRRDNLLKRKGLS